MGRGLCWQTEKIKWGKLKKEARIGRIGGQRKELRAGDKKWTRGLIENK